MQTQKPSRPTGVTIISMLALIIGCLGLVAGIIILGFSALLVTSGFLGFGGILTTFGLVIAGVVLFFGLIWVLVGWGFLNGKGWARIVGLIFSMLSVLFAIAAATLGSISAIVGAAVWILMIYYLFTAPVKAFFGKGPATSPKYTAAPALGRPSMTPTPFTASSSSGSTSWAPSTASTTTKFCTNCGTTLKPGMSKCSNCGANL